MRSPYRIMGRALTHASVATASAWIHKMGQGTCATAPRGTKATHTFQADAMVIHTCCLPEKYTISLQSMCLYITFYLPFFVHPTADVDECKYSPCPTGGVCHNTVGGYRCSCRAGLKFSEQSNSCGPNINLIIGNYIAPITLLY